MIRRRDFLAVSAAAAAVPGTTSAQGRVARTAGARVRIALNAYSFDKPLRDGSVTLEDLVVYCAENSLDALDATGYYFPGYPKVPSDEAIFRLKRKAQANGVVLSGTGVRNDFAVADSDARKADVKMVKEWIEVAAKLGAPVIRVFSGRTRPAGHTFENALEWMVADFQQCVVHAGRHGVILGLQHHNDFLKTADETIRIVKAVDSEWFGVILDVGSLRQNDVYTEIETLLPYAVSWQLKENVGIGGKEVPTDLHRVKAIIDKAGYRGFLPIETLGGGDPRVKVAEFARVVRHVFGA